MNKLKCTPFPILETERLLLRQIEVRDTDFIYSLQTSQVNNSYLDRSIPTDITESEAYIQRIRKGISDDKYIYWVITKKDSGQIIGTICLWNFVVEKSHAELGYELHHSYLKQGYMREAFGQVIRYAIETLALRVLEAYTQATNVSSISLLKYYGFEKVRAVREKHSRTGLDYTQSVYKKSW